MSQIFSRDPVWSQTTRSGFRQQVFIMYHSTRQVENVESILNSGFNITQRPETLLGNGLYVSRDIEKTLNYGDVCFKLLVYPGKTFQVQDDTPEEHRLRLWQKDHSSAWIPANNKLHPSGREETCVKSSAQVRILGIAYGHELLNFNTQSRIRNLFGTGDKLDRIENRILDLMLEDLGIIYSTFVHQGSLRLMQSMGRGRVGVDQWNGGDHQLWSRTWDNCLENKATGEVLTVDNNSMRIILQPVDAGGDKNQKWRLDPKGRFFHKLTNRILSCDRGEILVLKTFSEADRESWRFRCLDQTKTEDTFVSYTPWQDMVSWD